MPRILVAGAGIGGLALAQALRQDGHDVAVFERDPSAATRGQGYRLHIDGDGNAALRDCLPAAALEAVHRGSAVNGDLVATFTRQLTRVFAQEFPDVPDHEITHVDRETFRRGLLTGLDDVVHFGRTVTGYTVTESGGVRVTFAEGGGHEGDLLVGADGVGSAIRRQLLPHATVRDLGLRCLYGRMPLDAPAEIPADFHRGFCWVDGGDGLGAGFAGVRFRDGSGGYLMTTLVGTTGQLGDEIFTLPPADLRRLAVDATAGWDPRIAAIFAHAEAFFPITIRAAERVDPWPAGPVTLLGDAIHPMPPTGGVGANTALQDAATLAKALRDGAGLAGYQAVMLPRGFAAVENSLRTAQRLFPAVTPGGSPRP